MREASFEKTIFKRRWAFFRIYLERTLPTLFLAKDVKGDPRKVPRKARDMMTAMNDR
jgi:hypothetical protein